MVGAIFAAGTRAEAAPVNDDFASRTVITGGANPAPITTSNSGATRETDEPLHADYGQRSIWYEWQAPAPGTVSIDTLGSTFDTLLGVYTFTTGSTLNDLNLEENQVASNDDSSGGGKTSLVSFNVTDPDTVYYIAVDRYIGDATGTNTVKLNIKYVNPPANDAFANAIALPREATADTPTDVHIVAATNVNGTKQSGEPAHASNAGGKSVWWNWTAPWSGTLTVNTIGSNFDTLLAVYTGNAVNGLTVKASNNDFGGIATSQVTLSVNRGTTYRIAVDGQSGASGSINLNLMLRPTNDAFSSPINLTTFSAPTESNNSLATAEGGEPNHAGSNGGHSLWWQWTAPSNGKIAFTTSGTVTDFNPVIVAYTGSPVNALSLVPGQVPSGSPGNNRVQFDAASGTTYRIAVDGYGSSSTGTVQLSAQPVITSATSFVFGTAYTATADGFTGFGTINWALGDGSTAPGAAVSSSGVVSSTGVGTVVVKAHYGTSAYSPDFTITVNKANQASVPSAITPTALTYGSTFNDATFAAGAGTRLGTATWEYRLSNSGSWTALTSTPVNVPAVGGYLGVRVTYSGDDNRNAATSAEQVVTINPLATTFALSGTSFTYTGAAQGPTIVPTPGAATFTAGGTTSATAAGSYTATATATGNYTGSNNSLGWTIGKATATVTLGNLAATYDGTPKAASATTSPAGLTVNLTYDGSGTAPTNSGSYAVVATISDANYQGTASGTLVISPAATTFALNATSFTYTGAAQGPTIVPTPAGATFAAGGTTSATAAGSYTATATANGNYTGSNNSLGWTIGKATATVTLGSLTATYDGTPKAASATTSPVGLTVNFTYNGSSTPPTNAGSYAVVATISDANYQGTASGTLVIGKATATVTLGSLTATYDGTPKAASATTSPVGLTVNFTYNGSPTAPTNAGSYAVVGTISNANYQGSASGTLVIGTAAATFSLSATSFTYTGSAQGPTIVPNPAGATFTPGGTTSATAAGSYTATATATGNYTGSNSSLGWTIGKATATVNLGSLAATYNGTPKAASATTSPVGLTVNLTYDGSPTAPTNVGNYAVVATISDANYQGTASGTLVISPAATTFALNATSFTYTGAAQGPTIVPTPAGATFTAGGTTSATAAGSYTASATATGNYSGSNSSLGWTIGKASATVSLGSLAPTYDGTPKAASATTSPVGLTVNFTYNGSPTAPTNAGSYAVVGTISDANYQGTASGTLVIGKASQASLPSSITPAALTYGGTFTNATFTAGAGTRLGATSWEYRLSAGGSWTVLTSTPVNVPAAGSYLGVRVTYAGDGNYNAATSAEQVVTIGKANQAAVPSGITPGSLAFGGTIDATTFNAGSGTRAGTASWEYRLSNSGSWTALTAPVNVPAVGTYLGVRVTYSGDGNYNAAISAEQVVTIVSANQAAIPSAITPTNLVYGGTFDSATFTAGAGTRLGTASWEYRLSNSSSWTALTAPVNVPAVGSYLGVRVTYSGDSNFAAATSAEQVVTVSSLTTTFALNQTTFTYTGAPQGPTVNPTPAGATFTTGGTTSATNVGNYTATATATGNYTGSNAALNWSITKADQAAVPSAITPVALTYGGTFSSSTFTAGAGTRLGTASWEYRLSAGGGWTALTSTPVNVPAVGGYLGVRVTYSGDSNRNAATSAEQVVTINPVATTFSLSATSFTYTGAAQGPAIVPNPAGATFTPGGTTSATAAGSYTATATATGNYSGSNNALNWTIAKATATVSLGSLAATYDGTPKAATATTSPAGLTVNFTYDGSATTPTNAGSYAVVATINDANYQGTASGTVVIGKAATTFALNATSFTYTGSAQGPTIVPTPAGATFTPGGTTSATAAGSYTATATANGNYTGSNSSLGWTIGKATATVSLGSLAPTYDGTPKAASATTSPAGLTVNFTYNGSATAPTSAGSYAVVATINDANYQGTASGTLVIGKAAATFSLSATSFTYTGSAQGPTIMPTPAGATFTPGGTTSATAAGSYTATATATGNYSGSNSSLGWTIGKATATVTLGSLAATYDGTPKAASATTSPSGLAVNLTYDGSATAPTNAGSYAVMATINDANYQGTASGTLVIGKAAATFALSATSFTYTGSPQGPTIVPTPAGATFTPGGTTSATAAGSYTATATANGNYAGSNSSLGWTIGKATATVTLGGLATTYDGTPKAASATTSPLGLTVNLTYNGSATAPTNAGSYAVVATITDANYQGTASGTLVIGKANQAAAPSAITPASLGYGGTFNNATFTAGAGTRLGSASWEYRLSAGGAWTALTPTPVSAPAVGGYLGVRVTYFGDGNYSSATSAEQVIAIAKANQASVPSTITPVSLAFGTTIDATTFNASAGAREGTPSWEYRLSNSDPWTPLSDFVNVPSVGGYLGVRVTYDGGGNYNAATSAEQVVTIVAANQASPPSAITPPNLTYGGTMSAATFAAAAGARVGSASWEYRLSDSGSWTTFTGPVDVPPAGSYLGVRVIYSGDVNYAAAISAEQVVMIDAQATTFALSQASFTYNGSPQGPTVIPTPAGATFATGGTLSATNVGNYLGTAAATGSYTGSNAALSWSITKANQTSVPSAITPTGLIYGGSFSAASFAAGAGARVGNTTWEYRLSNSGAWTALTAPVSVPAAGGYLGVRVTYSGDGNYNAATSAEQVISIAGANQASPPSAITPTSLTYGGTFSAANFSVGAGTRLGTPTWEYRLSNSGAWTALTAPVSVPAAGGYLGVRVTYGGDANYNAATSAEQVITIAKANQASVPSAITPTGLTYGGTFTSSSFTAGAGTRLGTPMWEYRLSNSGSWIALTTPVSVPAAGGYLGVRVTYSGDGNYNSATSAEQVIAIAKAAQAAVPSAIMPTSLTYGGTFDSTTFTAGAGVRLGSATWEYRLSNSGAWTALTTSVSVPGSGSYLGVRVTYSGDANYNAATSAEQVVTVNSATTTFALSQTSFTYTGVPQGPVINPTPAGATFTAGGTTTATPAGNYTATAVATGNYAGSNVALNWTIAKASQAAVPVINSAASVTFGTGYLATIANAGVGLEWSLGTGSTASGAAINATTGAVTVTGAGTVVIKARFAGDANYLSSAYTADFTITVNKASQAAPTISSVNTFVFGNAYTATANSGFGALEWALGSGSTATGAAINASSGAVTATGVGTVVIKVRFAGDATHLASAYTSDFTVTVNKASQGVPVISSPNNFAFGSAYAATANAGFGVPDWALGTGSTAAGAAINASTGAVTATGVGTVVIKVRFAGDATHNASAYTADFTVTVNKASQSAPAISSANTYVFGNSYTAMANSGFGALEWALGTGSTAPTPTIDATTGAVNSTGVGTVVIKVRFAGDATHLASAYTTDFTVTVTKQTQSAPVISSANTFVVGSGYTATANAGFGALDWTLGTGSTATGAAIDATTGAVTATGVGTVVIKARFAGDATHNVSAYTTDFTITVTKQNQSAPVISSANSFAFGNAYTATANTGFGALDWALGTGSTAAGAAINATSGAVTATGVGTVVVKARFAGDATHNASAYTADFTVTVSKGAQVPPAISSANTFIVGAAYTATANTGFGALDWALGTGSTATGAAINASTGAVTATGGGTVVIKVRFAGNANYNASAYTADFTITVTTPSQIPPVISGATTFVLGTAYTATANSGFGALVWSLGTGSTALHPAIDASSGAVTCTTPGTVVIRAQFAGDATHNPSPLSAAFTITVTAQDFSVMPSTFNWQGYLAANPDVAAAIPHTAAAAWDHYINYGILEGRTDGDFNVQAYLAQYPNLAAIYGTDLKGAAMHWYTFGRRDGLRIPAGFDVLGYLARNLDIAALFNNDKYGAWLHYYNYGLFEGRSFDANFIPAEYLELNTDLKAAFGSNWQAAVMHWFNYGHPIEDRMGRVPIGFNVDSYLARYPDLGAVFGGVTPTAYRNVVVWHHYLAYGTLEGRSDGDFEANNYLDTNPDLVAVVGHDLQAAALHWYFYGRREGRRIPGAFDVRNYRSLYPDVVLVFGDDLYGSWIHYRDIGVFEGRIYDDLFRPADYLALNPDIAAVIGNNYRDALLHWLFYGKAEGRQGKN